MWGGLWLLASQLAAVVAMGTGQCAIANDATQTIIAVKLGQLPRLISIRRHLPPLTLGSVGPRSLYVLWKLSSGNPLKTNQSTKTSCAIPSPLHMAYVKGSKASFLFGLIKMAAPAFAIYKREEKTLAWWQLSMELVIFPFTVLFTRHWISREGHNLVHLDQQHQF